MSTNNNGGNNRTPTVLKSIPTTTLSSTTTSSSSTSVKQPTTPLNVKQQQSTSSSSTSSSSSSSSSSTPVVSTSSGTTTNTSVTFTTAVTSASTTSASSEVKKPVRRELAESPIVNSIKYYPKDKKENYLSHYLDLAKNGVDKNTRQTLLGTIAINLKNSRFLNDMGLVPNKNCSCHKLDVDHKCGLIGQNDVFDLIQKHTSSDEKGREWENGICKSCGIEMTMWNAASEVQKISSFQICAFDVNTCLTRATLPNLRIYCRACCAIAEACHYDHKMMNYHRQIMFHMTGDISPGYYFPTIDIIDEKQRSVAIPSNRMVGDRHVISQMWNAQNGFVTFRLPKELELKMGQDAERKDKIMKYNCRNVHANTSEYFGDNDPDIKRIKSVVGVAVDPIPPKASGDVDGLSSSSSSSSSFSSSLALGGLGAVAAPKRGRKVAGGESKRSRAVAEAKAKLLAESYVHIEPYEGDDRFIVFKIPIDPRKSVKKKSLSAMTITALDKNLPAEDGNCLFSTRLISWLEEKFEYREFLCWFVDCARQVTPEFFPQKSSSYSDEKWDDEDKERIEEIGKISLVVKGKADEIKKLKTEIAACEAEKKERIKGMRSKIIALVDSNESLDLLTKHNLVATMSERKATRPNLKPDFLLNRLPQLLLAHKLISSETSQATISEKCKQITDSLFDSSKIPQKKKTTFTLKYYNEQDEKNKKEERKRKRTKT